MYYASKLGCRCNRPAHCFNTEIRKSRERLHRFDHDHTLDPIEYLMPIRKRIPYKKHDYNEKFTSENVHEIDISHGEYAKFCANFSRARFRLISEWQMFRRINSSPIRRILGELQTELFLPSSEWNEGRAFHPERRQNVERVNFLRVRTATMSRIARNSRVPTSWRLG